MTFAYWSIFFVYLVPFAAAYYAKFNGSGFTPNDNRDPRGFLGTLEGARARANAAQQNAFEINPLFAAAVIVAHVTGGADQGTINFWAFVFLVSRIAYTWLYIKDHATRRSLVWAVGLFSCFCLFVAAA